MSGEFPTFEIGEEVLVNWSDGQLYFGTVLKIHFKDERCLIKFDDETKSWIPFEQLQKDQSFTEIICDICKGGKSEKPNEIVLCDTCGLGYHQYCHEPLLGDEILKPNVHWDCWICTEVQEQGEPMCEEIDKGKSQTIMELPYNVESLKWDKFHRRNEENVYCYCGKQGDWYIKMLQCCRCRQWFHEGCIQCLEIPLFYGDRFHIFACAICNSGEEFHRKLQQNWKDLVSIALFNLTMQYRKKYYDIHDIIIPWIHEHWELLEAEQFEGMSKSSIEKKVFSTIQSHKKRFQCGKESKKRGSIYGLRNRVPPKAKSFAIPKTGIITDETLDTLKAKDQVLYEQNQGNSPVHLRHDKEGDCGEVDGNGRPNKKRKLQFEIVNEYKRSQTREKRKKAKPLKEASVNRISKNNKIPKLPKCYKNSQSYSGYKGQADDYSVSTSKKSKSDVAGKLIPKDCTLDSIIPPLNDYEGGNHPFKTGIEVDFEKRQNQMKEEALNSLWCSTDSENGMDTDAVVDTDFEDSGYYQNGMLNDFAHFPVKKKRGRKSKAELKLREVTKARELAALRNLEENNNDQSYARRQINHRGPNNAATNAVDKRTLDKMKNKSVSFSQLQGSVKSYFGAAARISQGEKCRVIARRKNVDETVQFLVEWEPCL